jgi:hypothetical protein
MPLDSGAGTAVRTCSGASRRPAVRIWSTRWRRDASPLGPRRSDWAGLPRSRVLPETPGFSVVYSPERRHSVARSLHACSFWKSCGSGRTPTRGRSSAAARSLPWGSNGRRPQGWYEFEAPPDLERVYARERSMLYGRGLLGIDEAARLEDEWRQGFDEAQTRFSTDAERERYYQEIDLPESLRKRWSAARGRRERRHRSDA